MYFYYLLLFLKIFILFYVHMCSSACVHAWVSRVSLVPWDIREGHQIPLKLKL